MKKRAILFRVALLAVGVVLLAAGAACGDDDAGLNDNVTDAAEPDVLTFVCGNNALEPGEQCDDGNRINGDGCSSECDFEAICGDGVQGDPEECDGADGLPTCVQLGHIDGTTACSDSCLVESDCTDEASGLVAWYKLDGESGSVEDSTFSGNGCSVHGALERGYAGHIGNAFFFNGTDAYADCGTGFEMDGMNGLTVEVWVHMTSFSPEGIFLSRAASLDASELSYLIGFAGSSRFGSDQYHVMFGAHDANTLVFSSGIIPTGEWRHVAGVYEAGTLTLYVDGEQSDSTTQSQTGPVAAPANARTFIGHLNDAGAGWDTFFEGYLDDIKVWSVARTAPQICADAGGNPDGMGHCDFAE
ncbi:MAG: LamG-like jellyroll fold domain-containing protein [bacterium]